MCACVAAWLTALPAGWSSPAAQTQAPAGSPAASHRTTFERYCLTCHTTRQKERGVVPFLIAMIIGLLMIIAVPDIALFLPNTMFG